MPRGGFFPIPIFTLFDDSGNIVAGGKIYFYAAGTTTHKPVYHDVNLLSEWTQPIVTDSAGRATSGVYGRGFYDVSAYDASDILLWRMENIEIYSISEFVRSNILPKTTAQEIRDELDIDDTRTDRHKHSYQLSIPDTTPNEIADGTNTGFSTTEYFISATLKVWINGALYAKDIDYTEDADRKGYHFSSWAPRAGARIQHEYLVDIS